MLNLPYVFFESKKEYFFNYNKKNKLRRIKSTEFSLIFLISYLDFLLVVFFATSSSEVQ